MLSGVLVKRLRTYGLVELKWNSDFDYTCLTRQTLKNWENFRIFRRRLIVYIQHLDLVFIYDPGQILRDPAILADHVRNQILRMLYTNKALPEITDKVAAA